MKISSFVPFALVVAFFYLAGLGTGTQASVNIVADFVAAPNGMAPPSALARTSNGNFYGFTSYGGAQNRGTIFRLSPNGVVTTLLSLDDATTGSTTTAPLLVGQDGNLYGMTIYGGLHGGGTIFKMTPAGVLTVLVSPESLNGLQTATPTPLVQGNDGSIYGVRLGKVVVRVSPQGTLSTVYSFSSETTVSLLKGTDGSFYGGANSDTSDRSSRIFKMTPDGTVTTVALLSNLRTVSLLLGSDGNFYGISSDGGTAGQGSVFKVTPSGVMTTLVSFDGVSAFHPLSLVEGKNLIFYGVSEGFVNSASFPGAQPPINATFFRVTAAGKFDIIRSYQNTQGNPLGPIIFSPDGYLYGTSSKVGTSDGVDSLFKLSVTGALRTLYTFTQTGASHPDAGIIQTKDGQFYGTTYDGGKAGLGTVYRLESTGDITTLASFGGSNGANPYAELVEGKDGNLYGTTFAGGSADLGTVYRVTPTGVLKTLVSFKGTNGKKPYAGLIQARDGNFYGTTFGGDEGPGKFGTVFRMTPAGVLTTLVSFTGPDGANPNGSLVEGKDGNFYGVTSRGGSSGTYGTLFKLTPAGLLTTLVSFNGTNGGYPGSGLVEGTDGNFYGSTPFTNIFKVTPDGQLTNLVERLPSDLGFIKTPLIIATDGNFYAATAINTVDSAGSVIQITPEGKVMSMGKFYGLVSYTSIIQGSDSFLYGTISNGGAAGVGAIYQTPIRKQTLTFSSIPDQTIGKIKPISLKATSTSGLPVTFTVLQGSASISGNILSIFGGGTVIVAADQPGDDTFGPAPQVTRSVLVKRAPQTISFPEIPDRSRYNSPVPLNASASGGSPVRYAVSGPITLSNSETGGFQLNLTGTGLATVTAYADENESYNAAEPVTRTFQIAARAPQTISFPIINTQKVGAKLTLTATASSGLPVTYRATGPATLSGNVLTITGMGTVNVSAYQSGNASTFAAPQVSQSFKVEKATQAITFPGVGPVAVGQQVELTASASSGLPITYTVDSGPATLSGSTITFTSAGLIKVTAHQTGSASYTAANPVLINVRVK